MIPKAKWTYFILCLGVLITGDLAIKSLALSLESKDPVFSLNIKSETLEEVVTKLAKASGYEIRLSGEWERETLSIEMKDVTLEEALRRCFKDYNHAVVWNQAEKQASVTVLGRVGSKGETSTRGGRRSFSDRLPGTATNRVTGAATDRVPGAVLDRGRTGDMQPSQPPGVSISGGDTDFVQGTRTTDY